MLIPICWIALKRHTNLFFGVFVLLILISCAKTPQQTIENPSEFYKHRNSIVRIENRWGFLTKTHGSGFFVQRNKVATNIHVIAHPGPVYVKSVNKKTTWKVEGVAAYDVKNDLVILKVVGEGEVLPLADRDAIRNNEPISVVAFPDRKFKVAEGTLHSIRDSDKWLRMKVDTTEGGSGGPILNSSGQVIGILASKNDEFSYAIPSYILNVLLTQSESTETLEQWHERKLIQSYLYYEKGKMNNSKKLYEKAITNLDEAIRLNRESIYAYSNRGIAKSNLGDYKGAIKDYDKAIQINPKGVVVYRPEHLGDYKGAIKEYDKAIKLHSEYCALTTTVG